MKSSSKVRKRPHLSSRIGYTTEDDTGLLYENACPCLTREDYNSLVRPNFSILSKEYPDFAKAWIHLRESQKAIDDSNSNNNDDDDPKKTSCRRRKSTSCFSSHLDHAFNVNLTRALLHKFFHLTLPKMPEGYLCPPVPNRLHYIFWLRILLREMYDSQETYFSRINHQTKQCQYKGLDIGCGASAIYPLLLSTPTFTQSLFKMKSNDDDDNNNVHADPLQAWKFLGTDIDSFSVDCAKENVLANGLQETIIIECVPPTSSQQLYMSGKWQESYKDATNSNHHGPIYASIIAAQSAFAVNTNVNIDSRYPLLDFCMTNPPFYSTIEETTLPRQGDSRKRTDMTLGEGFYPAGGEEAFVMDMINDSLYFKNYCTWYTSMLGKKGTLIKIEKKLMEMGLGKGQIRTTSFIQGKHTRWGIAWTFHPASIRSPECRIIPHLETFEVIISKSCNPFPEVMDRIQGYMDIQKISDVQHEVISTQKISFFGYGSNELGSQSGQSQHDRNPPDWILDIDLSCSDGIEGNPDESCVTVHLTCFSHSLWGNTIVFKLTENIQGEVCRITRRWRRRISLSSRTDMMIDPNFIINNC